MTTSAADPQRQAIDQLRKIVEGVSEGVIVVDSRGRILWANGVALAMHKVSGGGDLGATVKEYRARFRLRFGTGQRLRREDYPMEQAIAGRQMTPTPLSLHHPEDDEQLGIHRVHTLTLGNVGNEPDCYAVVHHDITRRCEAELRFERTFAANHAPALICRLSDLRTVKVNEGFLQMAQYRGDAVLGRTLVELDLFVDDILKAAADGDEEQGIAQTETEIRTGDGQRKYVLLAGQNLEVHGESCMLLTFADMAKRRAAEQALSVSEELFAKAFRLAPVPMMVIALKQLQVMKVNEAFCKVMRRKQEDVSGQTLKSLALWKHPGDFRLFVQSLDRHGVVRELDAQMDTPDGDVLDCVVAAERVDINRDPCVLVTFQDFTERKRTEGELIGALEAVMQDTSWFTRSVIERLAHVRRPGGDSAKDAVLADLTRRERDVLGALCRGLSDAEIAEQLEISRHTVRNHVATLYEKIGVNRRSAAVVWANERGFTGGHRKR